MADRFLERFLSSHSPINQKSILTVGGSDIISPSSLYKGEWKNLMNIRDNPPLLPEQYFSVDVETAGPYPPAYSMLSIGACLAYEPQSTFYVEIQPITERYSPSALSVSQMSLEEVKARGIVPQEAMRLFAGWIHDHTPEGCLPIMVAFNAPFDWSFINYYFHQFFGENPFGYSALDIKALFMGAKGVRWQETSMRYLAPVHLQGQPLSHHAMQDALDQAGIFRAIMGKG